MVKSYYIQTFGCLMNEYDSERIASILESKGLLPVASAREADIVILNTCSVREKPQHKVSSYIGQYRLEREKKGTPKFIGVMGCVAQQEGERLLKQNKSVDFVVGTDGIAHLDEIIDQVIKGKRFAYIDWHKGDFEVNSFERKSGTQGLVSITKGCNNFCSYCIVPYVRGIEKSRRPGDILKEVEHLAKLGVKEVTLLGQNVNSYGKGKGDRADFGTSFPELLDKVANVEGLSRVRFMTSHPKDFNIEMAEVIKDNRNICPFIHLPLQAGSNKILKLMNRKYTVEEYLEKIAMAKEMIPNVSFSSDFIVGFPSESDEDFEKTVEAVKLVGYDNIFVFNYSVRSGTAAADMEDDVPLQVKTARLNRLNEVQEAIAEEIFNKLINKKVSVMVEGISKKDKKVYTGRNIQNRIVNFTSEKVLEAGSEVEVTIVEIKRNTLFGKYL